MLSLFSTKSIIVLFIFTFFFNSLFGQKKYSLQETLQIAKQNSPTLRAEIFNINFAEADVLTARLKNNPQLQYQFFQISNHNFWEPGTRRGTYRNQQYWVQLGKDIQLPHQYRYKKEFANKSLYVSQKSFSEIQRNLFYETANKWLDVWIAQKRLDIIQQADKNLDTLVYVNKLRLQKQAVTQTDFLRTQLLSEQYKLQLKTARQNLSNELRTLKRLLGTKDSITIDTTLNIPSTLPAQFPALLEQALINRTDLLTAKGNLELSNTNINLQKSLALPQPNVGFAFYLEMGMPYLCFLYTTDLPFVNRNQGEIRKAQFQKTQAERTIYAIENRIQTEVINSYSTYSLQQRNLESFRNILQQSQRILNNVKYSYLRGGTTIIDFLEAQRSWLDTRQQYFETEMEFRKAYIDLLNSTGLINQLAQEKK